MASAGVCIPCHMQQCCMIDAATAALALCWMGAHPHVHLLSTKHWTSSILLLQDEYIPIVSRFIPGGKLTKADAELIAPIGNSPTFLSMKQMREVVPIWQNMSVAIYKDKEANGVSGLLGSNTTLTTGTEILC